MARPTLQQTHGHELKPSGSVTKIGLRWTLHYVGSYAKGYTLPQLILHFHVIHNYTFTYNVYKLGKLCHLLTTWWTH